MKRSKQAGLSLIEIMVTLGILSVAALSSAALMQSGQKGLRALDGGSQYLSSMSMLQLFFSNADPARCAGSLKSIGDGPAYFSPQPAEGSPVPSPLPEIRGIKSDSIVLASVEGVGGAYSYTSLFLEETFPSLRSQIDLDPSDSDPTVNATVYVGQLLLQAKREGQILGAAQLPKHAIPMRFTVRDADARVVGCQTSLGGGGGSAPAVDQIGIEKLTCENAFGGVYDVNAIPRCALRSLVLAADHAARASLIAALPSALVTSTGAPAPGVVVGGELFAQKLTASDTVSGNMLYAEAGLRTSATAQNSLRGTNRLQGSNELIGTTNINGSATVHGIPICRKNGADCPGAPPTVPTPIPTTPPPPTPTPSPSPTAALGLAEYRNPGVYQYVVPVGARGRIRIDVIGAGGSGGCGNTRNGEGGKRGMKVTQVLDVTGPRTFAVTVGESRVACDVVQNSGGTDGLQGGSSSFDSIIASGGLGGRRNAPGSGDNTCYPDRPEGNGESGPEDMSGSRALVCSCDNGFFPANQGAQYSSGFRHGCPTNIPGAGGGGGGDNYRGGRGGHGLVRVTPI